jgi:hypothetical protein
LGNTNLPATIPDNAKDNEEFLKVLHTALLEVNTTLDLIATGYSVKKVLTHHHMIDSRSARQDDLSQLQSCISHQRWHTKYAISRARDLD